MTSGMENDLRVAAAWAQAIMSAASVYAAAKLQQRFIERREQAARRRRIEMIRFTAKWALKEYETMAEEVAPFQGSRADFTRYYRPGRCKSALRQISLVLPWIDDPVLLEAMAELEDLIFAVDVRLARNVEWRGAEALIEPVDLGYVTAERAPVGKAAAIVERRAVELMAGRKPREPLFNLATDG
jgi:hypothetical protein